MVTPMDDILKRPVVMDNVEVTGCTYAYNITEDDMKYIQERDAEQTSLKRGTLQSLLIGVSDASRTGYFYNGKSVYFDLQARHCTRESLQEVIDHIDMYIAGTPCHWITGAME